MKRLVSKHEKSKKARRNQVVIGLALAFVMLTSVLGFALQGGLGGSRGETNQEGISYNGVPFSFVNGFWIAGNFAFSYNPYETQEIFSDNVEGLKGAVQYQGIPVYIYSESMSAEAEVSVNLGIIASEVLEACIEGSECLKDVSVKSCEGEDNLIIVRESSDKGIRQENNCVIIEGPSQDLLVLSDGFLFRILDII